LLFIVFLILPPTSSAFLPYTTLFRSDLNRSHPGTRNRRGTPGQAAAARFWNLPIAYDSLSARAQQFGRQTKRREGTPFRWRPGGDRKSTRLNSSHVKISYAVFCLKKK